MELSIKSEAVIICHIGAGVRRKKRCGATIVVDEKTTGDRLRERHSKVTKHPVVEFLTFMFGENFTVTDLLCLQATRPAAQFGALLCWPFR